MKVEKIDWETLVEYWKRENHFDPDKKFVEVIKTLGPYKTEFDDPRRFAYGLFESSELIGATQLVHWKDSSVRFRTINIIPEHRGRNLGWELIKTAWEDWQAFDTLVGWMRNDSLGWAQSNGFEVVNQFDTHSWIQKDMT